MKTKLYFLATILLFVLAGCKSTNVMRCPEVSSAGRHKLIWAKRPAEGENIKQHSRPQPLQSPGRVEQASASIDNDIHIKIKMPASITKQLEPAGELEEMNILLGDNSNHKVSLQQNKRGKIFLAANSIHDIVRLSKNLAFHKASAPDDGAGGRIALAAGILGIIGLVLALGPWVGYGSFVISLLAIILGVIGLTSWRRGWALTGIILGVIAIAVAAALAGVFVVVLHL